MTRKQAVKQSSPDDENGELSVGYGKARITVRGKNVVLTNVLLMLMTLIMLGSLLVQYYNTAAIIDHKIEVKENDLALSKSITKAINDVLDEQIKTTEAQNETSWIVLQAEQERAKLRNKLSMPRSLQNRLRE